MGTTELLSKPALTLLSSLELKLLSSPVWLLSILVMRQLLSLAWSAEQLSQAVRTGPVTNWSGIVDLLRGDASVHRRRQW